MPDTTNLEDKLNCMFADVGSQLGVVIRTMIEQEIQASLCRIEKLKNVLDPTKSVDNQLNG